MRYVGQGHEIVVTLPVRPLAAGDGRTLADAFDSEYARLYGRTIPGQEREVLSWTLTVTAGKPTPLPLAPPPSGAGTEAEAVAARPPPEAAAARPGAGGRESGGAGTAEPPGRRLFDPVLAEYAAAAVRRRERLAPGEALAGPAVIVEDQTTTVVPDGFRATVDPFGYLVLERVDGEG